VKISRDRAQEIRQRAAELLKQAGQAGRLVDLLAVCKFLGLRVEYVEELGGVHLHNPWTARGIEVSGRLERLRQTIIISLAFPLEYQRYTLAHEIAHWILHPGLVHHREEANLDGRTSEHQSKPEEREAQIFAAALLMPDENVTREFNARFGGPIDSTVAADDLAYFLSVGTRTKIQASALRHMPTPKKAELFARCRSFEGRCFDSIAESFEVSIEAMAYSLTKLGLVY
jgi:Zn-dependent peptidase ImmA (M78 family)